MANDYVHLARKGVVAVEIEGTEGDVETFVDADFNHFVSNLRPSLNIAKYMREGTVGDLGTLPAVIGTKQATLAFTCELKGSGVDATTNPELHDLIMGCGRQQETLERIIIGAVADGPFLDGETITGGTSTATGVVFKDTANGTTTLLFVTTTGTFQTAEVITGSTSGASATSATGPLKRLKIGAITGGPFQDGETITGTTSSATGVVYGATATGAAVIYYAVTAGVMQTAETITGTTSSATATTASAPFEYGLLYRPDSDGGPSVSLGAFYVYDTTNEYATACILAGARGTMEIVANDVDEPVLINFSFTGKVSSFANATTVQPSPSYDPYPPLPFLGVTLSAFGYEPVMSSISVNTNNTLTPRKSAAEAEGILSHYISKRDPRGRCNPEMTRMADWDPYTMMTDVTDGAVGFAMIDSVPTAGRGVEVHCPHCNIEDLGVDEVDGIVHWAPEFACHKTSLSGFTDRDVMMVFR